MKESAQLLIFTLDAQRYALRLEAVACVVRAVAVTPLPDAPEIVHGIINVHGRIVPVINMRSCFRLQDREMRTSDQFVILSSARRVFALVADEVIGVVECPAEKVSPAEDILPHMDRIEGIMIIEDGMLLISDIDKILSLDDEAVLSDQLEVIGGLVVETAEEEQERENDHQ